MIILANIFQNGMVLQRQKPVSIWGEHDISQTITITVNGITEAQDEFAAGQWKLVLPARQEAENQTIEISGSTGDRITLERVDFGEVWIAGGQSNMEYLMKYDYEYENEQRIVNDPHLRFYDVPKYAFEGEEADGFKNIYGYGVWRSCDAKNLEYYSAVGYYFAQQLRKQYKVPVAIVGCNWGGTSAAAWTDYNILREDSELKVYTDTYEAGLKTIDMSTYEEKDRMNRSRMSTEQARKMSDKMMLGQINPLLMKFMRIMAKRFAGTAIGPHNEYRPGGLYLTMLKKITGLTCRGVIWYQGESDEIHAPLYGKLFTTMINCWRKDWNEELPFLFVQLAPFGKWLNGNGLNYPIVRSQQELVSKNVPNTWMASIMDEGMELDIHPKKKRPVGERLALLARGKLYGENILCEPPEIADMIRKDSKLMLHFIHVGERLYLKGKILNAITILVDGKECKKFSAQVQGNEVILEAEVFTNASRIEVHFADVDYCEVNLYNSADLPAKPFIIAL